MRQILKDLMISYSFWLESARMWERKMVAKLNQQKLAVKINVSIEIQSLEDIILCALNGKTNDCPQCGVN